MQATRTLPLLRNAAAASRPRVAASFSSSTASSSSSSSSGSFGGALRPTAPRLMAVTQPRESTAIIMIGAGLVGAGIAAQLLRTRSSTSAPDGKWVRGGFQAKMDRKEAAAILGLRETALTKARIKEAHRRMMIANHPDRGGAPYLASKVNEAKDLLDRVVVK